MVDVVSLKELEDGVGTITVKDGQIVKPALEKWSVDNWNRTRLDEDRRNPYDIGILNRIEKAVGIIESNYGKDYSFTHEDGRVEIKENWMGGLTAKEMANKIYRGIQYTKNTIVANEITDLTTANFSEISLTAGEESVERGNITKKGFESIVIPYMVSQIGSSIPEVLLEGSIKDYSNIYSLADDVNRERQAIFKANEGDEKKAKMEVAELVFHNLDTLSSISDRFTSSMREYRKGVSDSWKQDGIGAFLSTSVYVLASPLIVGGASFYSLVGEGGVLRVINNVEETGKELSQMIKEDIESAKELPGNVWASMKERVAEYKENVRGVSQKAVDFVNNTVNSGVELGYKIDEKLNDPLNPINVYLEDKDQAVRKFVGGKFDSVVSALDKKALAVNNYIDDKYTAVVNKVESGVGVVKERVDIGVSTGKAVIDAGLIVKDKVVGKVDEYIEIGKNIKDVVVAEAKSIKESVVADKGVDGLNDSYAGLSAQIKNKNQDDRLKEVAESIGDKYSSPKMTDVVLDGAVSLVGLIAKSSGELLSKLEAKRNQQKSDNDYKGPSNTM